MSEMKSAVGTGTGRSGDDLCVENSLREFKIWADVLNYGKKILKNAGIAEADLDSWYLFEHIFGISRAEKTRVPHSAPADLRTAGVHGTHIFRE